MKSDILEFVLGHLQNKRGVGHKNIASQLVFGHFLVFSFFEFFKHLFVSDSIQQALCICNGSNRHLAPYSCSSLN